MLVRQDEFAFRSHSLAQKAFEEGKLKDILPVKVCLEYISIPSRFTLT